MISTGIDIGSRTIKIVCIDSSNRKMVVNRRVETTFNPLDQATKLLDGIESDRLIATGYGRRLAQENFGGHSITEIQAHALGARHVFSECQAILDIGGQDTKAISLDLRGKAQKFEMNDRCAAGTGKFLEFMATSFQVPIEEFGSFALAGVEGLKINSMCTVFAEAEATSLMARGSRPQDIAFALHLSVVKRSISMLRRVTMTGPIVFSGGVALNPCIVELVRREMAHEVLIPEDPEMIGALGAALYGIRKKD
ncbi:MAG: acyl-CoA dehydratase activase [Deltaproteobacteria bacterium]|nr:acyl-CoA dehydratase activase [Deltaproteobacteria bacterium]